MTGLRWSLNIGRHAAGTSAPAVVLLLCSLAWGHGQHEVPRHVAEQGRDTGDCVLPVRPCRTIQYAQSVAGKGDRVLVAAGTYEVRTAEDVFYLTSGVLDVKGGFNRFDHFARQAPEENQTTLVGAPIEFRGALRDRGFHVVVDAKGLRGEQREALAAYRAGYVAMNASSGRTVCSGGMAGSFQCSGVDLLSHVALTGLPGGTQDANDIWGFVDLNTEREYALLGLETGVAIIDVSDPDSVFLVGKVPGERSLWRDVKVLQTYDRNARRWRSYGYVSTEAQERIVIIDLTGLPNGVSRAGSATDNSAVHNVHVSNVDFATGAGVPGWPSPLLQVLGSNRRHGAFRSYRLSDPAAPSLAGQSPGNTEAHYTHDATSMVVEDGRKTACGNSADPCEVLFDFSESTFDLWDLSNQASPKLLSSNTYEGVSYVHSGWWSENKNYLFVHDELDERVSDLKTTLRVFDLTSLTAPVLAATWTGPTDAIDHNGSVRGNRYYMSNYTRGLTVLDITDPESPRQVGYFDTYPVSNAKSFNGAWGVYPFLPSGSILVSDINSGLYVLADRTLTSAAGRIGFTTPAFGGAEGTDLEVTVSRSGGSSGSVSVDYTVYGASAGSNDFTASEGTLEWSTAETDHRTVTVPLTSDGSAEPIERAFVRLTNPAGGAVLGAVNLASLFIGDAGNSASLGFAEPDIAVSADDDRVIVTVERRGTPVGAVTVSYATSPLTAVAGTDYRATGTRQLRWEDGDGRPKTVVIGLLDNNATDSYRRFQVQLSSPSGAMLSANPNATVEIRRLPPVAGFTLVNSSQDADLQAIQDGATVQVPASAADSLSIRAEVEDVAWLGSVQLALTGPYSITRIEDEAPYTLFGDDGRGDYEGGAIPDGSYEIKATPYWETEGEGDAGAPLTLSFSVAGVPDPMLGQVTGVQVAPEVESLAVTWDAVAGADGYKVQWRSGTNPFGSAREQAVSGGNVTQQVIRGLTAGTNYDVRVIATQTGATDGQPSAVESGAPRARSPGQVTGVRVTEEVGSLGVSWNTVANADGYKVRWRPGMQPFTDDRQHTVTSGGAGNQTIGGLTAGTEYGVVVIATRTYANEGPASAEVTGVPKARSTDPPPPPGGGTGGSTNRPPVVEAQIPNRKLAAGEVLELDITGNFYDHDQRALDYFAESEKPSIATVTVNRQGLLTIRGIARGATIVTVTAADRRDERASQSFVVTVAGPALVALFPAASESGRQGFLRVINRSAEAGDVTIEAFDDEGTRAGPVTLSVAAGATAHFNSEDLEKGNADKGLSGSTGAPDRGDWRLILESELEVEVLSFVRAADGFITAMHDTAPLRAEKHHAAIFNPGSNEHQQSRLRLSNPGEEPAAVRITGIDDAGESPGEDVDLTIPAGASLTFTARELETGAGLRGALGDSTGKWRLSVESDVPISVMSLLSSPTGHLTNLSTAPSRPPVRP